MGNMWDTLHVVKLLAIYMHKRQLAFEADLVVSTVLFSFSSANYTQIYSFKTLENKCFLEIPVDFIMLRTQTQKLCLSSKNNNRIKLQRLFIQYAFISVFRDYNKDVILKSF